MAMYEVRCETCRVTFPLGTKRCLHCGGRLGSRESIPPFSAVFSESAELDPELLNEGEAEQTGRRGPTRLVMSLIWVLLAVVGSFYRICTG
jgi:hypothetical protein